MAEDFIDKFNRLLGNRAGIPLSRPVMPQNTRQEMYRASQTIGSYRGGVPAGKKAQEFGLAPKKKSTTSTKGKLTAEQKLFNEQMKLYQTRKVVEDAMKDATNTDWKEGAGALLGGAGKVIDFISRPFYGINEGLREVSESVNAGEPIWSLGDDLHSGFREGMFGSAKTHPGEVAEEAANRTPDTHWSTTLLTGPRGYGLNALRTPVGPSSSETDEPLPEGVHAARGVPAQYDSGDAVSRVKQAQGLIGEIGLDPLTWGVGGAARSVIRETGEIATEATLAKAVRTAAVKTAREHLPQVKGPVTNVGGRVSSSGEKLGNSFTASLIADMRGADEIGDVAGEAAVKAALEITRGAQAGKLKIGKMVPAVANAAAEAFRKVRLTKFEDNLRKFAGQVQGTSPLTIKQLNKLMDDPYFAEFHTQLLHRINSVRTTNRVTNWDQLFKALKVSDPKLDGLIRNSAEAARGALSDDVVKFMNQFGDEISKITYNAPGIRIWNKNVTFRRVGLAYSGLKDNAGRYAAGEGAVSKFSYERNLPGRLSILGQRAKSMGIPVYDKLRKEAVKRAREFSSEERKIISRALDNGTLLTDPRLEAARQWIRQQYDDIFDEEVNMGVRQAGERMDNYQFVFNKRGTQQVKAAFKAARKEAATKKGGRSLAGHTVQDAAQQGLRPIEDAFSALLYRKLDSNRRLTRAWFKESLLENYGLQAKRLTTAEKNGRNLVPMGRDTLSDALKSQLDDASEWYLPKAHHQVMEIFDKLTRLGNRDANILIRIFDNLINKFKFLSTVLYPGFHIRNMIGDVFMGFLDGVRSRTYGELFKKIQVSRRGGKTAFEIGDRTLTYDELNQLYMQHAAAGKFHSSDLDASGIGRGPKRATDALRSTSEKREDFGRLAHFLHAMREEYSSALRSGKKNAWEKATEASVYRVNHYKFDYNALTAVEHQIKRVAVPFYTYTRKAIPTLMEALWLSPGNMGRAGRLFTEFQGEDFENFNPLLVPEYQREVGYALLNDEKEPWAVGGELLPFPGAFNALDFTNGQEFAASLVSRLNPIAGAIPEQMAGEYSFSGRPIGSPMEYMLSKLGPYGAYEQVKNPNTSLVQKILSARAFMGLPIRRITEGQQDFTYETMKDSLIDEPFRLFNREFESSGIRIYISTRNDGTSFQVRDSVTNQVLYDSEDPVAALKFAKTAAQGAVESRGEQPESPGFDRDLMNKLLPSG